MPGWNFADVWEVVAQQVPDATAQVQGDRRVTWREFDRRANGVAQALLDAGRRRSRTRSPSTSTTAPSTSSRCSPPSRPASRRSTRTTATRRRARLPLGQRRRASPSCSTAPSPSASSGIRDRVPAGASCGSGSTTAAAPCPEWATPYEAAAAAGTDGRRSTAPWGRDGDHLLLLYTGGTTGMPKGVMWRQDDLFRSLVGTFIPTVRDAEPDLAAHPRRRARRPASIGMPACPLMHGTGCFTQLIVLSRRRLHGHPREPQPRRRGAARHRSSARR